MIMIEHAERYIALKQYLGFRYQSQGSALRTYTQYAAAHGDEFTLSNRMIEWAAKTPSVHYAREKLREVRKLAIWLHAEDERHEVPPHHALGRPQRVRPTPYLLTREQIGRLMEAALSLPPVGSIAPHMWHFAIGLIAATGMRRSEATSLRLTDITQDGLIIRKTKYRKDRLVVLHDSVWKALNRYLEIRNRNRGSGDHLLILSNGTPPSRAYLSQVFVILARQVGLRGGKGEPGPRLHSLRHSFAVRSLENAHLPDRDSVRRHMLALSTYLGHSSVANTYWYLEATPPLLRSIANAAEDIYTGRISQ